MAIGAAVWLGKVGTTIASSPALVGLAIGGVIVGTVGSLTLGGRAAVLDPLRDPLPLFACPDARTVIGQVSPGQQVLVTGRSADGGWLEVLFPDGLRDRAWGERAAFTLEADPGSLPVASCADASALPDQAGASLTTSAANSPSPPPTRRPAEATAGPTEEPLPTDVVVPTAGPTATPKGTATASPKGTVAPTPTQVIIATATPTIAPTPTLAPTAPPTAPPTPTLAPTPTPDVFPPTVSNLTANPATISYPGCPVTATTTISVTASDTSPITVTLFYMPPGTAKGSAKAMPLLSGTTYQTTVTSAGTWELGSMTYYVEVVDSYQNLTRHPKGTLTQSVNVVPCFG